MVRLFGHKLLARMDVVGDDSPNKGKLLPVIYRFVGR